MNNLREQVHAMVDTLSEEQLQAWMIILGKSTRNMEQSNHSSVRGIFSDCANPTCIPLEKHAWEGAAIQKHDHS